MIQKLGWTWGALNGFPCPARAGVGWVAPICVRPGEHQAHPRRLVATPRWSSCCRPARLLLSEQVLAYLCQGLIIHRRAAMAGIYGSRDCDKNKLDDESLCVMQDDRATRMVRLRLLNPSMGVSFLAVHQRVQALQALDTSTGGVSAHASSRARVGAPTANARPRASRTHVGATAWP